MQGFEHVSRGSWKQALMHRLFGSEATAQAHETNTPTVLLVIGHSHIQALIDAEIKHRQSLARAPNGAISFIKMLDERYYPNIEMENGRLVLNKALTQRLNQGIIDAGGKPIIVDCISGNEYHFFGLVQHARPFDFVLPAAPHLPLQPGAEIIPSSLVEATMRHAMEFGLAILSALREATELPIWHIQSPPPILSETHILAHPTQFKEAIEEYGVAPATLRWKLWQLQSQLYQEACEAANIHFLPTPALARDPNGFLMEAGWSQDPTHANSWYGELVLAQLATLRHQETGQ
jgi:hypothetical protein